MQSASCKPAHCGVHQCSSQLVIIIKQDQPFPIGYGETISAPHMHAEALRLLEDHCSPGASVLDVGSGETAFDILCCFAMHCVCTLTAQTACFQCMVATAHYQDTIHAEASKSLNDLCNLHGTSCCMLSPLGGHQLRLDLLCIITIGAVS